MCSPVTLPSIRVGEHDAQGTAVHLEMPGNRDWSMTLDEKICVFDDVYNEVSACSQAEREKTGAFGMLARMKLWDRPKDADINLVTTEKRYEPMWLADATRRTRYLRKTAYSVKVENAHARSVDLLGQTVSLDGTGVLRLDAVEHCEQTFVLSDYFDGLRRPNIEKLLAGYAGKYAFHEVGDGGEMNFVTPTMTATSVLQQVKSRLTTPVEADEILEDVLDVRSLCLFYRPVYAFQFEWKGKPGVIEIDGLSGRVNKEGNLLGGSVRSLGSRDVLFDFGAEFASLIVPGGSIVIKLVDRLSHKA